MVWLRLPRVFLVHSRARLECVFFPFPFQTSYRLSFSGVKREPPHSFPRLLLYVSQAWEFWEKWNDSVTARSCTSAVH